MLKKMVDSEIGCNIAGCFLNILAYADDMVLLPSSWRGLQHLLKEVEEAAMAIDMIFNTYKTLCMIFSQSNASQSVTAFHSSDLLAITCHLYPHLNTWFT